MNYSGSSIDFHKKKDRDIININIICLTVLLYLFRATIPFLKFPFLLLFIYLIIYSIIFHKKQLATTIKEFFRNFYIPIILAIILVISFLTSNKLYLAIFKDIFNTIVLLSLFFLMSLYVKSKNNLNLFYGNMIRLIIFFALLISFSLLHNSIGVIPTDVNLSSNKSEWNSLIGSLTSDYNFAIVPVILGLFGIFYFLRETGSFFKKIFLNIILIIYSITIFLSGSRRGLIILTVIIIFLLCVQLFSLFKRYNSLKKIGYESRWFLLSITVLAFLIIGFVFVMPVQMKKNTLHFFGISTKSYKYLSSNLLYRYSGSFTGHGYDYYQQIVWSEKQDTLNPYTLWGSQVSTREFPLTGENVKVLPENSVGYKMDRLSKASTWDDNAYSFTNISNLYKGDSITADNEYLYASVYCYVSKDYDGDWAKILAGGKVSGKTFQEYDLNKKGVWQKLSICFKSKGIISPVYLYWSKSGVTDFNNLNGYIIFSDPEYRIIKTDPRDPSTGWGSRIFIPEFPLTGMNVKTVPQNTIGYKMDSTCDASTWDKNAYSYTNISDLFKGDSRTLINTTYFASVYCFVSEDFDGSWAMISVEGDVSGDDFTIEYDFRKKGTWQKLQVEFKVKSGIPNIYLYWSKTKVTDFSKLRGFVIFAYPQYGTIKKNKGFSQFIYNPQKIGIKAFTKKDMLEYNKNFISYNSINNLYEIKYLKTKRSYTANQYSSLLLSKIAEKYTFTTLYQGSFVSDALPMIMYLYKTAIDKDPVRVWSKKFISEDTTYYGYKKNLTVNKISNGFLGDRLLRWEFANEIFINEYNWKQKIFGGGFGFLNWYGYFFLNNKKLSDYPHNPFLSVLLYSGILGIAIYLLMMYKVFYYYLKHLREYTLLFIFFIIAFFFSFFSGGSPFDPPIMGFFMILPFYIHYIHNIKE